MIALTRALHSRIPRLISLSPGEIVRLTLVRRLCMVTLRAIVLITRRICRVVRVFGRAALRALRQRVTERWACLRLAQIPLHQVVEG